MLSRKVCKKCTCVDGKDNPKEFDYSWYAREYVFCRYSSPCILNRDSEPPENCPYILEHKLAGELRKL